MNLLKSGIRQWCQISPYLLNIVLEGLAVAIGQQKEIKDIQTGKKEVKLLLFANDMIVSINDSKNSTREILQVTNPSIMWQETKSTQKNQ